MVARLIAIQSRAMGRVKKMAAPLGDICKARRRFTSAIEPKMRAMMKGALGMPNLSKMKKPIMPKTTIIQTSNMELLEE